MTENGENLLVAQLFDMEQTTFSADIGFPKIVNPVDNGGAYGSCYTVVVGLSDSSDSCDWRVGLQEVVLGQICNNKADEGTVAILSR